MNRCLKMIVLANNWQEAWSNQIQKEAQKLEIEGVMQAFDDEQMRIMICGKNEKLDDFVDYLYDFFEKHELVVQELEPFIKERDYRGIFRVI
jgi:acylphosphatase